MDSMVYMGYCETDEGKPKEDAVKLSELHFVTDAYTPMTMRCGRTSSDELGRSDSPLLGWGGGEFGVCRVIGRQ